MQNYGVGDLLDEIGINRVMLLRTADKMNQEKEHLSFRDHLDALRAVSYATGRIASLLEIRAELFKPYKEVEDRYKKIFEQVNEMLEELGVKLGGQEKWDEAKGRAEFREMFNADPPPQSLKSNQPERKGSP